MNLAVWYRPDILEGRDSLVPDLFHDVRKLAPTGITFSICASPDDLGKQSIDLVHCVGTTASMLPTLQELRKRGIPVFISPLLTTSRIRWVSRLRAYAPGTDEADVLKLSAPAPRFLAQHAAEQSLLASVLGVHPSEIPIVPLSTVAQRNESAAVVPGNLAKDAIVAVSDARSDHANTYRLLQALEKVNHPSVVILRSDQGRLSSRCLTLAKSNPNLRLIDASILAGSPDLASACVCQVFVDPSLSVLRGLAVLTAAVSGARIVVSRHGAMNGYLLKDAEYVEPTSWELIHHGILTALNKEGSGRLRERIANDCSEAGVLEKLLSLYSRAASHQE